MSTSKIARISITLPADLVRFADREARRLDRSRSWVIAEALRAAEGAGAADTPAAAWIVREVARAPYSTGTPDLGWSRRDQLVSDLALTPEERVREAEETVRLSELVHPRGPVIPVILFDRFEDYLGWKDRERWSPS